MMLWRASGRLCPRSLFTTPTAASRGGKLPSRHHQQRWLAQWSIETEHHHKYEDPAKIIDEGLINRLLEETKDKAKDAACVKAILVAAQERARLQAMPPGHPTADPPQNEFVQGLTLEEAATLLNVDSGNKDIMQLLYDAALNVKQQIYGNRIVLFAPVYLANWCVNTCQYCAFRGANKQMQRSMLTMDELRQEVEALEAIGHKRLLLLTGEHPKYSFDRFLEAVQVVGTVKTPNPCGEIRRINVEIPSLSVSDMRRLKATQYIGTYTLFQETYHRDTFRKMHPGGPKSDYNHRILTMDRAQLGGLDDVGIGALFGLADYRFEVLGLLMHAHHLDRTYGTGPHTISIPRMQPALNAPAAEHIPLPVHDDDFKKLVAVIRCAVPYTGMILSTRESAQIRRELLRLGISQISAGSRTDVGAYHRDTSCDAAPFISNTAGTSGNGYRAGRPAKSQLPPPATLDASRKEEEEDTEEYKLRRGQFCLQDHRPLDTVIKDLLHDGFIPSFCTACYRKGRTGAAFMKIAKSGRIQDFCQPNALLSLQEYMEDYASPQTKAIGAEVIHRESQLMSDNAKRAYDRKRRQLLEGKRDLYF
ncbi:Fe-Fe hydrogenase maturation protein [Nannochloropsis gaditana CCMP526]|uniref:Fe-Fe hydrogenase maturation protein n=1 Tax=Nannochloropsis gaditana (strain CCMP526) TaxID=1093141 RepID=UPI00029F5F85|nr:Fe-Fe hydrogenase maturation protein [Nannochloropsis gaditana CCMP526]EKU21823.1 Fe-Fe hydrogenase maturation protein [Nannochloropsis gaditana CCMP526]|eukprot:XP_005854541.1 Fe-Fe hydrogenase maturation protein [Nannochloropsis gaditana CCMP526]